MLDHDAYELEFTDGFGEGLDPTRWLPHYLPHWSTPERSAARFDLYGDTLRLRVDADQPAWRPEDGELRVSNLQTGSWSGPQGSTRGQHRHRPDLVVRSPQPERWLYAPSAGLVEADLRAVADPTTMLACWLVGFEADSPDQAGEICVVELFGDAIGPAGSTLSLGVKAHGDPRLHDDMVRLPVDLDATDWHSYATSWDADSVRFFVDGQLVHHVAQRLDYPMQLMIDLFEFPPESTPPSPRKPAAYPKTGEVRRVRGYRISGPSCTSSGASR